MPTYSIKAPDGRTYSIQGPAGATDAQVRAEVLRQNPAAGKAPAKGDQSFSQAFFGRLGRDVVGLGNPALQAIVGPTIDKVLGANTVRDFTQRAVQPITLGAADEVVSAVPAAAAARKGQPVKQAFSQSQRQQSQERARIKQERPKLATAADVTGGAASLALPLPAVGAAKTLKGAVASGSALGGAQGFLSGFLGAEEGERFQQGSLSGLTGAALGGALPYAVSMGGNVIQRLRQPPGLKPIDPSIRLLAEEGVSMTPGQMRGGVARSAEEAGTSLPFLGTKIAERRTEGLETFNRAVTNRVLKPVGQKLPDDVATGSEAVKYARKQINDGYENAIPSRAVRLDPAFSEDAAGAFDSIIEMTPAGREQLEDIIFQRVTSRIPENGIIDGRRYKTIQSDLDKAVERFSKSMDSDDQAMAETLQGIQSALEGAAKRQDPDFATKIQNLDRSWAELVRLQTAAAKDTELGGMFTPAQYRQAILSSDRTLRRRGVAEGDALSQDLAKAALKVLPSKTPDSGTAGRAGWGMLASVPGAIAGAAMGGPVLGPLAGIGGTAAALGGASRLYTPEAIEAANAALRQRMVQQTDLMARLGGELPPLTPFLPGMRAPNPFAFTSGRAAPPTRRPQ